MTHRFVALLMPFALFALLISCKRESAAMERMRESSMVAERIRASFERAFPDPQPPFEDAPHIGSVGEWVTKSPRFLLHDFPVSNLSRVESWVRPLIAENDLDAIVITYSKHSDDVEYITGWGVLRYNRDGSVEHSEDIKLEDAIPQPSLNGSPLMNPDANKTEMATPKKPSDD